jgi:DNA-directed RNA polymerase subunit RPC12/RpoP
LLSVGHTAAYLSVVAGERTESFRCMACMVTHGGRETMADYIDDGGTETLELPTGETVERLWRCADCGHISADYVTEWVGGRKLQRCEECGNRSLITYPGDVVDAAGGD